MRFRLAGKVIGGLVLIGIAGTVGVITYVNHSRPAELGLASVTPRATASATPDDPLTLACRRPSLPAHDASSGVPGLWVVQPGSVAGYRAHEKFAEITSPHEAVARTESVRGWLLVGESGGSLQIETGCVAVDVRTLRSIDELPGFNTSDRDGISRDFLNASSHPYVIFQPYPGPLAVSAATQDVQHLTLAGDLEIGGVTRPERFALDVRLQQGQVAAAGRATVQAGDFAIEVPQEADGFVRVDPQITLEVSLVLLKA